ncbi:MAG: MtrB/PioB family outer membrane beta-barrel protein [Bdellovibrionota bacterium]
MKIRIALLASIAVLCWQPVVAFGEFKLGEYDLKGSADIGYRSVTNDRESARFNEFRDISDGIIFGGKVFFSKDAYFTDVTFENVGLNNQFYGVKGGRYTSFKYSLFYNETPHNYSFGARSFYSGIGTNELTYTATDKVPTSTTFTPTVSTDPSTWTEFDYATKAKTVGADVDLIPAEPYFLKLGANKVSTTGKRPVSYTNGVCADAKSSSSTKSCSNFGSPVELPLAIDYTTTNFTATAGYHTDNFLASADGLFSRFANANDYMTWRDPYVTSRTLNQVTSGASDNDYKKIGIQGTYSGLPFDTTLALRGSYSKLSNTLGILDTIAAASGGGPGLTPTYEVAQLTLNTNEFKGDIAYKSVSVAAHSELLDILDSKLYYSYLNKKNSSTKITFSNGGYEAENELFSYRKNDAGLDLGLKLPAKTKAMGGFEYMQVHRERHDAEKTTDKIVYAGVKNNMMDFMTAKLKVERMWRISEGVVVDPSAVTGQDFNKPFDAAGKVRDAVKLGVDLEPIEHLELGAEYAYKKDRYTANQLGLQSAPRTEVFGDIAYQFPFVKVSAFGNVEKASFLTNKRTYGSAADPAAGSTSTTYNWSMNETDYYWAYGFGVDVPVMKDKLDVSANWQQSVNDGQNEFMPENNIASLPNIYEYDDYRKSVLDTKVKYRVMDDLDTTLGYAYEKFRLNDIAFNNYQYYNGSSKYFLSGAGNDHDYTAHMVYVAATYRF